MLCLLYLFLIVLGGLLHKTVEQQNLLSLYNVIVVYRKKNRPILVADRYTQFIKIRINRFLTTLVFTTFTSVIINSRYRTFSLTLSGKDSKNSSKASVL